MIADTSENKEGILLKSGTNEVEFIEFFIGKVSYGINVAKVQRVIALSNVHITQVAQAQPGVLGVIHIQNKPIMLIDLRVALHLNVPPPENERQLVLVTKFNRTTTAFMIDAVSKIHRTSWKEFEPVAEFLSTDAAGYTTGTVKIGDRVVLILDLERLMIDFNPEEQSGIDITVEKKKEREQVNIVYAEDSKVIRSMMLRTLNTAGYTKVQSFEHGQAAYDYLQNLKKDAESQKKNLRDFVDLIITDIEMPKMDGLTLCKQIKSETGANIPSVVVFSSLINEEMARKCKSVGADAQISKPHGDEIIKILDELCIES